MSNSAVGLNTPSEFLKYVVGPDMGAFASSGQAELRLAYHACTSLFSLRDWVYEARKNKAWTFLGKAYPPIAFKTKFFEDLCSIDPDFEIISDIANATKHMVLDTSRRLTDLHGAANVHIQTHGGSGLLGFGALGGGAIGSMPTSRVFVQIGTGFHDVLQVPARCTTFGKSYFLRMAGERHPALKKVSDRAAGISVGRPCGGADRPAPRQPAHPDSPAGFLESPRGI
jgi:hypothetical protein